MISVGWQGYLCLLPPTGTLSSAGLGAAAALSLSGIAPGTALADEKPSRAADDTQTPSVLDEVDPDPGPAVLEPILGPAAGGEDATVRGPYVEPPKFIRVEGTMMGFNGYAATDDDNVYAWGSGT